MIMETRRLEVKFLSPAFLGNAQQSGQWRTPPFKALLRQWWRVAFAAQENFHLEVEPLRQEEAELFGSAAGDKGCRSRLRLRLNHWSEGTLKQAQWSALGKIGQSGGKGAGVDAGLYLGYGPVELPKRKSSPTLKRNAAIQAGEHAVLELAFPAEHAERIDQTLALIHRFGTLGGRSRNGWGSLSLGMEEGNVLAQLPLRDWRDCLDRDWVHAIGRDDRGALVWQTPAHKDWKSMMVELAQTRKALCSLFPVPAHSSRPEPRDWLSYPVTKHSVRGWGNLRLPNSLRFKVVEEHGGQLRALIFHMPCLPIKKFQPDQREIERVWQQVHAWLDHSGMKRIGG